MTTRSQIIGKYLRGQALDEYEIQELERAIDDYDRLVGLLKNRTLQVDTLEAGEAYVGKATLAALAVRVKRDNNQAIDTDTDTFVEFESKGYDDAHFVTLVSDDETISIPSTGVYMINWFVRWEANATGVRSGIIQRSVAGGAYSNFAPVDHRPAVSGQISLNAGYDERYMNAGDTLKLLVRQTSGGALNVINAAVVVRQLRRVPGEG